MSKILVQICCSVDSHYFLESLRGDYPDDEIVGFFYNPNIHPFSEYMLRYKDVEFSCKLLGITLLDGLYDIDKWYEITKGYENEPEKGERCSVCFDDRLGVTALKAREIGCDSFTTTLLMSPLKSQEKLHNIGLQIGERYNLGFIYKDYRSGQGGINQSKAVKDNRLYRQNYCGCMYALNAQRVSQNKLNIELMSPISQQILPNSIEERLELFALRDEYHSKNIEFFIKKVEFLNYRLLQAWVSKNKTIIPSYFLPFSYLKSQNSKGKIEFIKNGIGYLSKNGIMLITIEKFNLLANKDYENTAYLMKNPLLFEEEISLRRILTKESNSLSPIVIVDCMELDNSIEIRLNSTYFIDTKEQLETIS